MGPNLLISNVGLGSPPGVAGALTEGFSGDVERSLLVTGAAVSGELLRDARELKPRKPWPAGACAAEAGSADGEKAGIGEGEDDDEVDGVWGAAAGLPKLNPEPVV